MHEFRFKDMVRDAAGRRCSRCGLSDRAQKLLTGRCLHVHRKTPGEVYTVDDCECLCYWCHQAAHNHAPAPFPTKLRSGYLSPTIELGLPDAELARLDALAKRMKFTRQQAVVTALALLQLELEKAGEIFPDNP